MEKFDIFMIGFLAICLLLIGFSVSQAIGTNNIDNFITKHTKSIPNSEQDIILDCQDKNLEESCNCLRNNILTIYDYKIRDETEKTFNDIKENGGDCYDYSLLYERLAKGLGFQSTTRMYKGEYKNGEVIFPAHQVTMVWEDNNPLHCRLDMLKFGVGINGEA